MHTPIYYITFQVEEHQHKIAYCSCQGMTLFNTVLLCSIKDSDRKENTRTSVHELLHICAHILQVCLGMPLQMYIPQRGEADINKWEDKQIFCVNVQVSLANVQDFRWVEGDKKSYRKFGFNRSSVLVLRSAKRGFSSDQRLLRDTTTASFKLEGNEMAGKEWCSLNSSAYPQTSVTTRVSFQSRAKTELLFDGDVGNLLQQNQTSAEQPDPPDSSVNPPVCSNRKHSPFPEKR